MLRVISALLISTLVLGNCSRAADSRKTEADLKREAASAEFTRKTKEANYPALFEKAAAEFNVPADVLKGIAFAETRWEHLTWPPGETASPETGMPRPYGIISLQDNEFFGHSLTEAARLIGKDPEELKKDPFQNMRGAAALLKKIYAETPKPAGTTPQDIESWRYAIAKYCGIPEPGLQHQHALDVYVFMNKGYHQFGIEWNARPVNLGPMREDVKRIVAEEQIKMDARMKDDSAVQTAVASAAVPKPDKPKAISVTNAPRPPVPPAVQAVVTAPARAQASADSQADEPGNARSKWMGIVAVIFVLIGGYVAYRNRSEPSR